MVTDTWYGRGNKTSGYRFWDAFLCLMLLAASLLLLQGCSGSDSTGPLPMGVEVKSIMFDSNTMDYLSGYNSLEGKTTPACLRGVTDIEKDTAATPYTAGYQYSMTLIEKTEDIYNAISVNNEATSGLGIIAKTTISASMSNEFHKESNSIYVLVKSVWDGPKYKVKAPTFDKTQGGAFSSAAAFRSAYPTYDEFTGAWGDYYISAIRVGARCYGMLKFKYNSTSEKNEAEYNIKTKAVGLKTSTDIKNLLTDNTSQTQLEVNIQALGAGATGAMDASSVTDLDSFFKVIDDYSKKLKNYVEGIGDKPDPNLVYGAAVSAQIDPYQNIIQTQYGIESTYFTAPPDPSWINFRTILDKNYGNTDPLDKNVGHNDAYNQLSYIYSNPDLFASASSQPPFQPLTSDELASIKTQRDKFEASSSGLVTLLDLCQYPDSPHQLYPNRDFTTDPKVGSFNGTTRDYCKKLYGCSQQSNDINCQNCDNENLCSNLWFYLTNAPEASRMPFITDDNIESNDDGAYQVIDKNNKVKFVLPKMLPQTCKDLQQLGNKTDGNYTTYFGGDITKPYTLYCDSMVLDTPQGYLTLEDDYIPPATLDNNGNDNGRNFSSQAWTDSDRTKEYTAFKKIKVEMMPEGLKIIRDDYNYARSSDPNHRTPFAEASVNWMHNDWSAGHQGHANLNFNNTPFALVIPSDAPASPAPTSIINNIYTGKYWLWTLSGRNSEFANWYPAATDRPNSGYKAITITLTPSGKRNKIFDLWIAGYGASDDFGGKIVPTGDLILTWVGQ